MQSFFDKRAPRLDTSLPSVRHVQDLIRNRTIVQVTMVGGQELEGTIKRQAGPDQSGCHRHDAGLPLSRRQPPGPAAMARSRLSAGPERTP